MSEPTIPPQETDEMGESKHYAFSLTAFECGVIQGSLGSPRGLYDEIRDRIAAKLQRQFAAQAAKERL